MHHLNRPLKVPVELHQSPRWTRTSSGRGSYSVVLYEVESRQAQSPARPSGCGITKVMDFLFLFFFLFPVMRAGCTLGFYWVYFERCITGRPICCQIVLKALITMQSLSQHALHQKMKDLETKRNFKQHFAASLNIIPFQTRCSVCGSSQLTNMQHFSRCSSVISFP